MTTTTTTGAALAASVRARVRRRHASSKASSSTRRADGRRGTTRAVSGEDDARGRGAALALAPREVMDSIEVPAELVQVRAYVRWEEAGMPEDTTEEWRQSEYDEALLDLKIELLRGTTMNELRARYKMEPVEGGDVRMFTEDADLARRVKAAETLSMKSSADEVITTRDELASMEFIDSVVGDAEDVARSIEVAIDEFVDSVIDGDEVANDDVFASMTPEELTDMETALNDSKNWSTRAQLVAAIMGPNENMSDEQDAGAAERLATLLEALEETKEALTVKEEALSNMKIELENLEEEIVVSQATTDKALAEIKESWAAEVSQLKAELKMAQSRVEGGDEALAQRIEALLKEAGEARQAKQKLETELEEAMRRVEDAKVSQIKAEAVRDANAEVILMLKKDLETTKEELHKLKSNSRAETEFQKLQAELDRAWEAASEIQTRWDNDRKVIDFLTKSIDDEKAKREAREAQSIPAAAMGILSWARGSIEKRAADVSSVSQQTLENVARAYQDLEASTGAFSDDVIADDSESDFLRDM